MEAFKQLLQFMPSPEDEDCEARDEGELHYASFLGNTDMLIRSIANVEDINMLDSKGQTPLYVAASKGHKEIVEILLKRGADPNISSKQLHNTTPLHDAPTQDIAALLIANGADIEARTDNGDTPLHIAIRFPKDDKAKLLLANRANVNAINNFQMTPLHLLCECVYNEEDLSKTAKDLIEAGAFMNLKDIDGRTALHYLASTSENHNTHYTLLMNGAKIDIQDNKGYFPVHYLIKTILRGKEDVANILKLYMSQQNAANLVDFQGRSALHYLCEEGDEALVQLAVDQGGSVSLKDHAGRTPLHCFSDKGDSEAVVRILVENGADVDSVDAWGRSPLMTSVDNEQTNHTEALIKRNANVNVIDKVGNTALHLVCYRDNPALVKLLLKYNADIHKADANNTTPLHAAAYSGALACADLLVHAGADKYARDSEMKTPVDIAKRQEQFDIISVLSDDDDTQIERKHNRFTNVAKEFMSLESVLTMLDDDQIAHQKPDIEQFISELLSSPVKGRGVDEEEALEIQKVMDCVIKTISSLLEQNDNHLQCTVLHAGSTSEGTKIRCPDEFDFMLCLETLSELVEPEFPKKDLKSEIGMSIRSGKSSTEESDDTIPAKVVHSVSDYAYMKVKDSKNAAPFRPLLMRCPVEYYTIPCCTMYAGFSDIISKVLFSKDFPKDPRLIPLEVTLEPAIEFRWHGARYKDLKIGVDLVPALRLTEWPERIRKDNKLFTMDMLKRACLTVPKMTSEQDEYLWRCSLALVETNIFRLLRPKIRNSYIACKCMLSSELLPMIDFGESEDIDYYKMIRPDLVDEDNVTFHEGVEGVVPSYVIKMTFLSVLEKRITLYGTDFVYDLAKLKEDRINEIGETGECYCNNEADYKTECKRQKVSDVAKADAIDKQNITPNATDTADKVEEDWYGPALTMFTAQRSTDFDINIVRDVFTECEKRLNDKYVPSAFNPNHNVLGNSLLSGDVDKAIVYIRIINKLLAIR